MLENGVAYGTYRKFNDDGTEAGDRAFVWIPGKGALDLGEHLVPSLEQAGWELFDTAAAAGWGGYVVAGTGVPEDGVPGTQAVFLAQKRHPHCRK